MHPIRWSIVLMLCRHTPLFAQQLARPFPSEKQSLSFITHFMDSSYGIPDNTNAEQVAENPLQPRTSPELDNGVTMQAISQI